MNNPIEELATKIRSFLGRVAEGALDVGAFAVVATDEVYSVLDGLRTLQSTHAWCLTPSFPPYVIFAMATTARETSGLATGHAIYRFIRDWLRQNDWSNMRLMISEMQSYRPITAVRHKVIRDAMAALKWHGKNGFNAANLAVPSLFAIIDGMLTEFAEAAGVEKWNDRKRGGPKKLRAEFERVTYAFDTPALDLIFEVLFASSIGVTRRLNRHKILHGEWLRYGRIEHLIRTILIVDFLGYVIDEYVNRQAASDWTQPVSDKSVYSKLLSESPVESIAALARQRLTARGLLRGT